MTIRMNKTVLVLSMLFILLMTTSCSGGETQVDPYEQPEPIEPAESQTVLNEEDLRTFTLEELAEFDGKDGAKAYVAVQGVVYDVTDLEKWEGGIHNGYDAGQDLTDIILNKSPHGLSTLERATIVGYLE